jgi:hypothetical protein
MGKYARDFWATQFYLVQGVNIESKTCKNINTRLELVFNHKH